VRSASASLVLCAVASGCVTPPPPLPPRRIQFTDPPQQAPLQRAPDVPLPAEPPIIHERYMHWTLLADAAAIVPLTHWMGRPSDVHLALPSLLLPPLIHLAHGESDNAAISFVLRGLMIGGVYLAARNAETECDNSDSFICVPIGSILLAGLAITTVVTVDSIFLAKATRRDQRWYNLPVQPSVGVTPNGGGYLSLSGQF
jgi:hypothetical protein